MGRGIAYPYDHFLLLDDNNFLMTQHIEETDEFVDHNDDRFDYSFAEFDKDAYDSFKDHVAEIFGTNAESRKYWTWLDNEAYIFAETDRLEIGIDSGGGSPCLFIRPKTYEHSFSGEEIEYKIDKIVIRAFNELIKAYPDYWFGKSTSAWTAYRYKKGEKYA